MCSRKSPDIPNTSLCVSIFQHTLSLLLLQVYQNDALLVYITQRDNGKHCEHAPICFPSNLDFVECPY